VKLVTRSGKHGKINRTLNVGASVTDVRLERTITGAPTLEIDLSDPEWSIIQSPMLDLNVDGKLDHVEVQYRGRWYRLVKVTPNNMDVALTFENRVVGILRQYSGARHKRRTNAYTRAMFIRSLIREANADGHAIGFRCPRLRSPQEVADTNRGVHTTLKRGHTAGRRGFAGHPHLTITGSSGGGARVALDRSQLALLEEALNIAHTLNAPARAQWALVEAMIVETGIHNLNRGDLDSLGVLQVRTSTSGSRSRSMSVKWSASHFLQGYSHGGTGAIHLARTTSMSSGAIAQAVQRSAFPERYQRHEPEAKRIVDAFHGMSASAPTTITVEKAYNYTRKKGENSWDCMNRLADEVNWKVWVVGNDVFYMSEPDLYHQKPRMVLRRDSPAISNFGFDWDQGKHLSAVTFSILKQRWQGYAGESLEITGAGPADQRWIVADIVESESSATADVTLNSISKPRPEPAPQVVTKTIPGSTPGGKPGTGDTRFDELVKACKLLSRRSKGYIYGAAHTRFTSISASGYFDCSSSVSFALWKAGLMNTSTAMTSGWFASSWGRPGTGKDFTVWANAGHVFMEFNHTIKRFDTSPWGDGPNGPRVRHTHRPHWGFTPRHYPGM